MPPTTGRWGRIIAVTRLATGLILFFYVLTHNLNHALGLISLSAMEAGRTVFLGFWRPLELVLLLAAVLHLSIGLRALYRRKSLRMPFLEATQLALGLAAPPLLLLHILGTSVAHALYGVDDRYAYVLWVIWLVSPGLGVHAIPRPGGDLDPRLHRPQLLAAREGVVPALATFPRRAGAADPGAGAAWDSSPAPAKWRSWPPIPPGCRRWTRKSTWPRRKRLRSSTSCATG